MTRQSGLYDQFHTAIREAEDKMAAMDRLEMLLNKAGVDGFLWFSATEEDWLAERFERSTTFGRGPLRLKVYEILYMWKGHYKDDPVVEEVQKRQQPFTSLEIYDRPLTKRQQSLVALTKKFGYVHDYIVPTHLPGRVEGMVFFILSTEPNRVEAFKALYSEFERIALHCSSLLRPTSGERSARSMVELTTREHECLGLVARGFSNREIAAELNISERTVKYHVSNLLQKFDVQGRGQLIIVAAKQNMLTN